jgi:hypothetical protein
MRRDPGARSHIRSPGRLPRGCAPTGARSSAGTTAAPNRSLATPCRRPRQRSVPHARAISCRTPRAISCRIRAPTVRKMTIHGYLSRHWRSGATTAITFSTGLARQCCRNISDICHLRGGGRKIGWLRIGLDHDGATLTRVPCSGLSLAFPPFGAPGVNEEGISCG